MHALSLRNSPYSYHPFHFHHLYYNDHYLGLQQSYIARQQAHNFPHGYVYSQYSHEENDVPNPHEHNEALLQGGGKHSHMIRGLLSHALVRQEHYPAVKELTFDISERHVWVRVSGQ